MLKSYSTLSAGYDDSLSALPHYTLYPEMAVAVGLWIWRRTKGRQ